MRTTLVAAIAAAHLSSYAQADSTAEIRFQLQQLREQYEARIKALEQRLDAAEKAQASAAPAAPPAPPVPPSSPQPAAGLALSAVLSGTYANLRNDPETYRIQGFIPGSDELAPSRSFSLGESEITLAANVDPYFSGRLTFALTPDNEAEVEEAYFRTSALPHGLGLTGGRFLSSIGYLNNQHAHTWDFVDAPLAYQAFFGGQHHTDGVQLRWIAPTETYFELTSELGLGNSFPGNDRNRNSPGSFSLGGRIGGDIGESASWRTGFTYLRAKSIDRAYDDLDSTGTAVTNAFTGDSDIYVLDGVLKWAPAGDARNTSFKLQGEYFRRRESGTLSYDLGSASLGAASGDYGSRQSGWYLQGVYQFARSWRVGLRYDRLSSGTPSIGLVSDGTLTAADFPRLESFSPERTSAMVDYSLTEFSRLRLQLASDRTQPGRNDRQLFLQYIMSLGAHGAHRY